MKSMASLSTEKSPCSSDNVFSHKRYFINNLDGYHGEYILKEISNILDKNAMSTKESSQTIVGEDVQAHSPPPPDQSYEIIGTVTDQKIKAIDHVTRIISKTECVPVMLTCGTVILDISYERDELRLAVEYMEVLKALLEKQKPPLKSTDDDDVPDTPAPEMKRRFLILISTVMTWSQTKPLDPDNPDMPFIEMDFRKRKPHPNYKMHYDVENEVIGVARKYRSQIGAFVISSGVTYGGREDVFYFWFQKAWECEPILPILGRGSNTVPLINVADLAKIVYNLVVDFPKKLYILAVEQTLTKQREIIKPLGRIVGSGMFKSIPPEDAFLIQEIDQRIFDLMTLNLSMEPTFIVETMGLQWTSELTFAENVPILMKQFKKERGLKPFKVLIYGPPVVGKTTLAKLICEAYGLVYISPETVVHDILEDLSWRTKHWETGELGALSIPMAEDDLALDADEDTGEDEGLQETARQTLAILQSGRPLTDEEILGYLRQRMLCREALNRGWVLDGFPNNLAQCNALFERGDEQDSDTEDNVDHEPFDEDIDLYNNVLKKLLPDIVVSLDATDDFICEKAMRQPESDSRFDEEVILKRLTDFRAGDSREITPLNFFDELDIHPLVVPVKDHTDYDMKQSYSNVTLRMGRPCRYGKLVALIEAAEKKKREERELAKAKEALALKERQRKLKEEREEKMEYWTELYALLRDEEEAALAAAGEPMRNYLVHHIFPTLTPALLEVAKLRPDDPIDFLGDHLLKINPTAKKLEPEYKKHIERFIRMTQDNVGMLPYNIDTMCNRRESIQKDELKVAEHLFKLNPTGKMLEPGYNLQAEKLMGKVKILDEAIKKLDIQIEPLLTEYVQDDYTDKSVSNIKGMTSL